MKHFLKHFWQRSFLTQSILSDIEYYYELSEEYLLEAYNDAFIKLFRRAITHSPFYRDLYGSFGITIQSIKDLSDISRLPEITKQDINTSPHPIISGIHPFIIKGNTSGTTGTPMTTYRTPFSISTEMAYVMNYRQMNGFKQSQPLLSIRGSLGKKELYYYDKYSNTLYISGPGLNDQTMKKIYPIIHRFNPYAVEAFPSYLHKFSQLLDTNNLKLNIPIAFTSSEMLYEFQRQTISLILKSKIYDWYGNVERTIALAEDKKGNYRLLPLYSINEYRQDAVITTGLNNFYFPLIRYRLDDIIEINSGDLLKNIVSPDIISIQGRSGDVIDLPDGSSVGCIDHAFKGILGLKQAQVHQYSNKQLDVWVHTSEEFTAESEKILNKQLEWQLGLELKINIQKKELKTFIQMPGKKYRLIIKHQETVEAE